MSIIRAQLVGDVVSGSTFAGIVTATGFDGDLIGNVTGNVDGNLSGIAATSVFAVEARFAANAGIATTSLSAETAYSLSGNPNITVGVVTATSYNGSGLGLTSLNATNLSTGTVPSAALGSGTANSSTFLRGDRIWSAVPAGGFSNMQVFTSPGTFFVPPSTTKLKVTATGGGGSFYSGQSGSAGGTGIAVFNVAASSSIPVTVGAQGGGPSPGGTIAGGSSAFGGFVVAGGGNSFTGGSVSFPGGPGAYQATLALAGGNGAAPPIPITGTTPGSSPGGASYWGSAGVSGFFPSPGLSPTIGSYGAGGGVGPGIQVYGAIQGVVVVEW